jgi:hypothetical protein
MCGIQHSISLRIPVGREPNYKNLEALPQTDEVGSVSFAVVYELRGVLLDRSEVA